MHRSRTAALAAALAAGIAMTAPGPAPAHEPAGAHVAAITRELALRPGDPVLWLERAEYLRAAGRPAAALADLDRAAELAPGLALVLAARGRVLLESGDPAGAAATLGLYVGREPDDPDGWALLARAELALGRDAAAVAALDAALAAPGEPAPDLYLDRSRALARIGGSSRARAVEGLRDGIARLGPAPALLAELRRWGAAADPAPAARVGSGPTPPSAAAPPPAGALATLTRGPYLQRATQTGITIRWRTGTGTDSRVRWGPAPGDLPFVADDAAVVTEHVVTLGGLAPDTRWYYSVGSSTETLAGDATTYFWTLPEATFTGPTRLWALGDSGLPGGAQNAVRDAYLAWAGGERTHLWLMLGDNAYSTGTDAEYQAGLFTPYAAPLRNQCLWPTRGNHDVLRSGANNDYYDLFTLPTAGESGGVVSGTEAYYAVDHGNIHLVCLDSEGTSLAPGGAMRAWLRADLLANTRPWVIAFWHHPPYTKGSHDSDDPSDSGGRMRDMRLNFVSLLDTLGVDLVLTGHSHSYERSMLLRGHYGLSGTLTSAMKADSGDGRPDGDGSYHKPSSGPGPLEGAVHAVAGSSAQISGGSLNHPVMIASLNVLGSLAVEVSASRLDGWFISSGGAVLDSFRIEKGAVAGVGPAPRARGLELLPARPNPARGAVRLDYRLPRAARVGLTIVGPDGRRVAVVASGPRAAGAHAATWDGRDGRGRPAPPGVYFAVLDADGEHRAVRFARVP